MTWQLWLWLGCLLLAGSLWADRASADTVRTQDAYIKSDAGGKTWKIGTSGVQLVLECRNDELRLVSCQNRLAKPAREYIKAGIAPFALEGAVFPGRFTVRTIREKFLPNKESADPADDHLTLTVKAGDMIGFAVGPHGDYRGDQTQWITVLDYGGGEMYASALDQSLAQGPVWFYYLHRPGTDVLEPIDGVEWQGNAQEKVRIPGPSGGFRAPGDAPHVGATMLHPSNAFDAIRVWRAPKAGTVSVHGPARHIRGYGDVDLKILKIEEKTDPTLPPSGDNRWHLESGTGRKVSAGGRSAVQLDLILTRPSIRAVYHVQAYPRSSILRQWVDLENTGPGPITLKTPAPFTANLHCKDSEPLTHYWMVGGNSLIDEGMLKSAPITTEYHSALSGYKTDNLTPWMAIQRKTAPWDGWFMLMDYLGTWSFALDHTGANPAYMVASLSDLAGHPLPPGEKIRLPVITLGVFQKDLEDMGERVYNWQYEYLWDYTHDDWYALMQWAPAWYNDVHNLQENFAGRLAHLDVDFIDIMRESGMEVLWDDAGWSENPDIWQPSREGPDFAQTLRYLPKLGMKWALWFCGHPSGELMDTKVGSWGDFQWRTDGQGGIDFAGDSAWRDKVIRFLKAHPRSSFHTCDGGSRYAHAFDIQRYADINMFSDPGEGDQTNYYLSYLETPDKWMDLMPTFLGYTGGKYRPDITRQILTMVPCWDAYLEPAGMEQARRIAEIYHYLLREGVAGRWTYLFHPGVKGDEEYYYSQRTSYDRTKACIILKHRAASPVTVFPVGLLPDHPYATGFDSTPSTSTRTGADLMLNGIEIRNQAPGELIYLGLPDRPGGGRDHIPPGAPGRVLTRRETNIGHTGIGVYWSPGSDNNWISYYEVRRGTDILGKVSTGAFFFDHLPGWDPQASYAVRTVDGDGNASGWTLAQRLADEPLTASILGNHFPENGRENWYAETSLDGRSFTPMAYIEPVKNPAGNAGGTGNQVGGVEGYWEGASTARIGRGWQQADKEALCARTWIAPQAGKIRILGRAMKEYYRRNQGQPLRVKILHKERQVWPEQDWALVSVSDLTGCSHDITLDVSKGDAIRFLLDRGDSQENDIIAWMPRIVYEGSEPEGSSDGVVRIFCGSDRPYTDHIGNVWPADRFFQGGRPARTEAGIEGTTPTPEDITLYQRGRQGKRFAYSIPVPPGLYAIRLKFAEPVYEWAFERPFSIRLNGREVARNMDICQAARGSHRAYERVFRYAVPDADGRLVLDFSGGFEPLQKSGQAIVQAIEVLPELRPAIRINAGSEVPFIDWNSFIWSADTNYEGGRIIRSGHPVSQASPTLYDQAIYQTARAGRSFSYKVAVPPGLYTVHLKFAELWLPEIGQRPMDIEINGLPAREAWDPARAAGPVGMAADFRVEGITPDASGHIRVHIKAKGPNGAILQGIEIE